MGKQEHVAQVLPCLPATFFPGEGSMAEDGMKGLLSKPLWLGQGRGGWGAASVWWRHSFPLQKALQQSHASHIGPASGSDLCWLCEVLVKGRGGIRWVGRLSCLWRREGAVSTSWCPASMCHPPCLSVACWQLCELRMPEPALGSMIHVCCLPL